MSDTAATVSSSHSDKERCDDLAPSIDNQEAERLKAEGNDYFRARQWDEALVSYKSALGYLPRRRTTEQQRKSPDKSPAQEPVVTDTPSSSASEAPLLDSDIKTRSILNANIGACYVKLGDHKGAVDACTDALLDDPHYVKALQRRATSNEAIGSWSALTSAQEDYNTLLAILPPSSHQIPEIRRTLQYLKPKVEAAQKREMDDMVGKLKDLGNSFLGNFGLSTDNFKFEPNGQGGYSMNFAQ